MKYVFLNTSIFRYFWKKLSKLRPCSFRERRISYYISFDDFFTGMCKQIEKFEPKSRGTEILYEPAICPDILLNTDHK